MIAITRLQDRGLIIPDVDLFVLNWKNTKTKLIGVLHTDGSKVRSSLEVIMRIPHHFPTQKLHIHSSRGESWMTFILSTFADQNATMWDHPKCLRGYRFGNEIDWRSDLLKFCVEYGEAKDLPHQVKKDRKSLNKIRKFIRCHPRYRGKVYNKKVYKYGRIMAARKFINDAVINKTDADKIYSKILNLEQNNLLTEMYHKFLKENGLWYSLHAELEKFDKWLTVGYIPSIKIDGRSQYRKFCRWVNNEPDKMEIAKSLGWGAIRQRERVIKTGKNNRKQIIRDDGKIYLSISSAAEDNNINIATISENLHGTLKTAGKRKYKFLEDHEEI